MATRKRILKVFIILILAVFLLSTGLISVLYLGGQGDSAQTDTGSVDTVDNIDNGIVDTGTNQ